MPKEIEPVDEQDFTNNTRKWFETSLNEHGYSFQYSVIKAAQDLLLANKSGWFLQGAEFPVDVRGKGTRIDFVLQRGMEHDGMISTRDPRTTLMIAECKRANPSFSNWCFTRYPQNLRDVDGTKSNLTLEVISLDPARLHLSENHMDLNVIKKASAVCEHKIVHHRGAPIYHNGVEVKTTNKGNVVNSDPGNDAIEKAASQVCLGLNGMARFLSQRTELWDKNPPVTLLPVIFTTANLWVSDANLANAELATGNLTFNDHNFSSVDWLIYQYRLSPGIKHDVPLKATQSTFSNVLQNEYTRSISIVNPGALEEFFRYATMLNPSF